MTASEIKLDSNKISTELFADEMAKKWVKSCLETNICTITFTKKNGDERVMSCTLDEQHFPPIQKEAAEVGEVRQKSIESLTVFDIDEQNWRAFRWDSIKRFEMDI